MIIMRKSTTTAVKVPARKYFMVRKYMGDDAYSWTVFRKGQSQPVCCGCSRREADYHADQLEKAETARRSA